MNQLRRFFELQVVRFMITGSLSTLMMLGVYVLLNLVMKYQISYLIAYVFTVIVSYFLNTLFVFKTPVSLSSFLQFPLVYLVQYIAGALLLEVFVRLGFSVTFAPLVIIILLLPVTFWLSRIVMMKSPRTRR